MRKKDEPVVVTSLDDFRQNARNRRKHAAYMKKAEAGDPQAWEEAGMDFLLGKAADMGSEDAKAALHEIELDSREVNKMEKSVPELAKELLKKNKYADHNDVIEVKNEHGNQFTFLFDSTGYNEYTQHILECQSDLFEKPISFCLTTISDSFDFREIEYNTEPVSKHEETLRRAIELALPVKPTERHCSREIQN